MLYIKYNKNKKVHISLNYSELYKWSKRMNVRR